MLSRAGQLVLAGGMVAAATIPAQAAGPTGGINQCVVLAICIEIDQPGSSGSPGTTGGGSGGSGGGGGPAKPCTWHGVDYPCWDPDRGYFVTDTTSKYAGCYLQALDPQPNPGDPLWQGKTLGSVYMATCYDANNNPQAAFTDVIDKPPYVGGPAPTPGLVAQMAIKKLQFARPIEHVDPKTGRTLVGTDAWLWYERGKNDAELAMNVGPQSQTVNLDTISVTATATLTEVDWDLGYQEGGKEKVVTCLGGKGPGTQFVPGQSDSNHPPADACVARFGELSPAGGAPPSTAPKPTASAMAGGGFWVVATEVWTVNTGVTGWDGITFRVSGAPVQVQVNQLQVLN
ncbi:hypothetical protein C7C46_21405 [Streptomyces tateyamensis]|uniref:ATP/GTP-binding protein n=2 Tax=Streptomyces tateyamensis TaxID=565073 RepID=A0A2V4N1Z5_9ACTN|nr:hypothetical protein C7C46_21405 [Streptomyces tateyamensis]